MRAAVLLLCRAVAVPLSLAFLGCHDNAPPRPPDAVFLAAGSGQMGTPGETLGEPFAVRVLDAWNNRAVGVTVVWEVGAGEGALCTPAPADCSTGSQSLATDVRGEARIWFRPSGAGSWTVLAAVDGVRGSPVRFSVWDAQDRRRPPDVLISFGHFMDCEPGVPVTFSGPTGSSQVTTRVGAVVEWLFYDPELCTARVVSTSAPDGASFDSGDLRGGQRFRLVPEVTGTWEFRDQYHGGTGMLTVQ